jgi:cyclase
LFRYYDSLKKAFTGNTCSKEYLNIKMMRPYFDELSVSYRKIKTRVPDTFVDGETDLDGRKRKVLLEEMGKRHTESDLIMYLPEERILFAGDLVFNEGHPYLGYGFHNELKTRLRELELMDPETVIPGHGDPGGKEIIISTGVYVEDIEKIAVEIYNADKSLDDINDVEIPARHKDWILGDYFYSNLECIFKEIMAK